MITFKEYLYEEDETDQEHENVQAAAAMYKQHCSQFPDIDNPLYRLSGSSWGSGYDHKLKTRVPRTRASKSLGGTGDEQEYLFSLPAWKDFPPRRQSIFCSTTMDFEVDSPADDKSNVLIIFPYDGVKIAVLPEKDLNTMNIARGFTNGKFKTISGLFDIVNDAYDIFRGTDHDKADDFESRLKLIRDTFNKDGKFNPEANGNDEMADKYAEMERDDDWNLKLLRMAATEFPEKLTPEAMGVKLVTSSGLDLPGETRECWFSGKYLSIPYRYYDEFKAAVKALDK